MSGHRSRSLRRASFAGALLGLLLVAGVGGAGPPHALVATVAASYPGCVYFATRSDSAVALTIDDGPDPVTTPRILALLARHRARATFFLIAGHLPGNEAVIAAAAAGGHELGNHLTTDEPSIGLTAEAFEDALVEAHAALAPYGGVRWARPGGGWYSDGMVAVMRRHGYGCALGSVYPYDAHVASARFSAAYVLRNVRPGSIIVLHDREARGRRTAEALGVILPELARRGYKVVTVSELMGAS